MVTGKDMSGGEGQGRDTARVATFYYAEVTNDDTRVLEPFRTDDVTHGKEPLYCCGSLRDLWLNGMMYFTPHNTFYLFSNLGYDIPIHYCPACGARIVFVRDMVMRKVERTRTVVDHVYVINE